MLDMRRTQAFAHRFGRVSGLALVLAMMTASASNATYPGRNGSIGFIGGRGSGYGETFDGVWMIRPSGGSAHRVAVIPAAALFPAFSPDGKRLAYVDAGRLYVAMIAAGRVLAIATPRSVETFKPAWSPSGRRVAFGYRGGIAIINVAGSGLHMLCHRCDSNLSWSSRNRIAYVVDGSLYSIAPDGAHRRLLNRYRGSWMGDDHPSWSPDGRRLAFDQNGGHDTTNVFTVRADGRDLRQLTNSPRTDSDVPAYSPDGSQIAYIAESFGQLWLMDANGSRAHALRTMGLRALDPDWQPLPR